VLELSSFQLHTTFSLNAGRRHRPEHHPGPPGLARQHAAYAADKARIFGKDTVRVLNRDDATVMRMAAGRPHEHLRHRRTGCAGSFGLVNERGVLWLANANPAEESEKKRRKKVLPIEPAEPVELVVNRLMPADALHIRGLHNASNALAALALCRAIGLPLAPLLHGLREYQGEPHRVELVAAIDGVEYYDDSKGTNVGATVAALEGLGKAFGETGRQILLIAGGDGKGQDFAPLAGPCSRYVKRGAADRPRRAGAAAAIEPSGVPCFDCARPAAGGAPRRRPGANPATPCCCRRPAPASTCSPTTPTARRCSSTPCASSRSRKGRRSDGLPDSIQVQRFRADAAIAGRARPSRMMEYDQPLVWVTLLLMLFGMVMVYSASIALPDSPKYASLGGKNSYFLMRQGLHRGLAGGRPVHLPFSDRDLAALGAAMFVGTLVLLALVLVPGSALGQRRAALAVAQDHSSCSRPR
jgi:hypothetical protein